MSDRGISADTILWALGALEGGECDASAAARWLEEASARRGAADAVELRGLLPDGPDSPFLRSNHVHVHCPGCRSVFRVWVHDLDGHPDCPQCGAAVACPLSPSAGTTRHGIGRAAETETAYRADSGAERFAHFDLLSRIGKGGAGCVYRARNRRTGRSVAVKICRFSPVESQAVSWKRALREVEAAALDHPHIVTVFHAGLAEGRPYVEMEYVPGGSARDEGKYSLDDARRICREVLSALSHAHDAELVHRDLKPSNVLLDAGGHAKVSDFGLCKLLDEESSTTTGKILGSPHFMAPEQWTDGRIGPYTDVYAAGLLFYYLLTGSVPFDAEDPLSVMYKHLRFELPDPREKGGSVSDDVVSFLRRATAKKPGDRFEDAEECLRALADLG